MRTILLGCFFFQTAMSVFSQYDPDKAWIGVPDLDKEELLWLSAKGHTRHFRALAPARRQQLINSWKKHSENWAPSRKATDFPARLGDEEAMQRIAVEIASGESPNPDIILRYPWPEMLIYVGPLLLSDEPFDPNAPAGTGLPASLALPPWIWSFIGGERVSMNDEKNNSVPVLDEHGRQLYQNVKTEFSDETIEWARRTRSRHLSWGPPEPTVLRMRLAERELMRNWWRANEGHFLRRDFKAVRPGFELPEPKSASNDSTMPADSERPAETQQLAPSVKSLTKNPAEVTAVAQPSSASSVMLWTGAIATIVLLAGLLYFWKRSV